MPELIRRCDKCGEVYDATSVREHMSGNCIDNDYDELARFAADNPEAHKLWYELESCEHTIDELKLIAEPYKRIAELENEAENLARLCSHAEAMLRAYTNYPAGSPAEFIDWKEGWRIAMEQRRRRTEDQTE